MYDVPKYAVYTRTIFSTHTKTTYIDINVYKCFNVLQNVNHKPSTFL